MCRYPLYNALQVHPHLHVLLCLLPGTDATCRLLPPSLGAAWQLEAHMGQGHACRCRTWGPKRLAAASSARPCTAVRLERFCPHHANLCWTGGTVCHLPVHSAAVRGPTACMIRNVHAARCVVRRAADLAAKMRPRSNSRVRASGRCIFSILGRSLVWSSTSLCRWSARLAQWCLRWMHQALQEQWLSLHTRAASAGWGPY